VIHIVTGVEEGFMFPPNPLIREIMLSSFAKAQDLHPGFIISHFLLEPTRLYLLGIIDTPVDVRGFMERVKTESAHAINRLLGKRKRTVWCERYDSPVVLDEEATIDKIASLYLRVSESDLAESIEKYPGFTSWDYHKRGKRVYHTHRIPRDAFPLLPRDTDLKDEHYRSIVRRLKHKKEKLSFQIEPDGWMKAFGILGREKQAAVNAEIEKRIRKGEAVYKALREKKEKHVLERKVLTEIQIGTSFIPEQMEDKMICFGSIEQLRKYYITMVKTTFALADEIFIKWKEGDFTTPFPLGLYPARRLRLAELWRPDTGADIAHW